MAYSLCLQIRQTSSSLYFKMPFYAVARGRKVGIFDTWAECESNVKGFGGAKFKKFSTNEQAKDFILTNGGQIVPSKPKPIASTNNYKNSFQNHYKPQTAKYSSYSSKPPKSNIHPTECEDNIEEIGSIRKKSRALKTSLDNRNDLNILSSEYTRLLDNGANVEDLILSHMDRIETELSGSRARVERIANGKSPTTPKQRKRTIMLDEAPSPNKNTARGSKCMKSDHEFMVDNEGFIQAYTDGACSNNGKRGALAGLGVYFGENHPLNLSKPVSGRATNNCGEIQAATHAIRQAKKMGVNKICINTDSKFLINSVTKWMPAWKRKGWKIASGEPVKNEIDFKELERELGSVAVKWNYVEAHSGILGNERADELARHGASVYGLDDSF